MQEFKKSDIFEYLQKELQKRGIQITEPDINDLMDALKAHKLIAKPGVLEKLIQLGLKKRGQANYRTFLHLVK